MTGVWYGMRLFKLEKTGSEVIYWQQNGLQKRNLKISTVIGRDGILLTRQQLYRDPWSLIKSSNK